MLSGTSVRSDYSRHKPHRKQINKFDRICSILEQGVKNLIVPVYYRYDLVLKRACSSRLAVVMPGLAILTAELLIGPAITDPVAAFKADRHFSYAFLILHNTNLASFIY